MPGFNFSVPCEIYAFADVFGFQRYANCPSTTIIRWRDAAEHVDVTNCGLLFIVCRSNTVFRR